MPAVFCLLYLFYSFALLTFGSIVVIYACFLCFFNVFMFFFFLHIYVSREYAKLQQTNKASAVLFMLNAQ